MSDPIQTTKMTCPYCRHENEVEIILYQTVTLGYTDLECTCPTCEAVWQAAEDAESHG
jgi:transcription elongation factor Elf1